MSFSLYTSCLCNPNVEMTEGSSSSSLSFLLLSQSLDNLSQSCNLQHPLYAASLCWWFHICVFSPDLLSNPKLADVLNSSPHCCPHSLSNISCCQFHVLWLFCPKSLDLTVTPFFLMPDQNPDFLGFTFLINTESYTFHHITALLTITTALSSHLSTPAWVRDSLGYCKKLLNLNLLSKYS